MDTTTRRLDHAHRHGVLRAVGSGGLLIVCLSVQSGWSSVAAAKPVRYPPVTMTFRCIDTVACASGDRVQGDPAGPYVGNTATMLGAFLNTNRDLLLQLDAPGGQYLFMDFSAAVAPPVCAATGSCRRVGAYTFTTVQTFSPDALLNPVDAVDNPLPDGLLGIPITSTSNARLKINFPDPYGRALLWTVRYNPTLYRGSTYVTVRRTSANSWIVTTSPTGVAKLVSWASHGVEVDEGTFAMPFQFTATQP